jgi:hypothetical protein
LKNRKENATVTDTPDKFDANDPVQLREFDDQLWKKLEAARAYYDQEAGLAESALGLFAANHGRIWELVEQHHGSKGQVWLQIATHQKRVVVVFHLLGASGEQVFEVNGLELIDPMRIGKSER